MFKRITPAVCLIMTAAIMTGAICSCSKQNDDGAPSGSPSLLTVETEKNDPVFYDKTFEGSQFIICSPMDDNTDFGDNYIDNEDYTGDPVNDAVVSRNLAVEDKYDVEIIQRNAGTGYAAQATRSDTVDFDLVYDQGVRLIRTAIGGVYCDLTKLKNVDLSRDYWTPSTRDPLTVGGKILVASCDISMNRINYADVFIFNKQIIDESGIPYPYVNVENNDWTFDKLIEICTSVCTDKNGDGLWTTDDVYGIDELKAESVVIGSGLCKELTVRNLDGSYLLNVYTEQLTELYNRYVNSDVVSATVPSYADWTSDKDVSEYDSPRQARRVISFSEAHIAFLETTLREAEVFINGSSDLSFGVIPMPKYSASQKEYYHEIDPKAPMFAVPQLTPDPNKTGAVLEYMAYDSSERLLPAFFDKTLYSEHMSDAERRDEKMLRIVRDTGYYRWTSLYRRAIYDPTGATWDPCSKMLDEMLSTGEFASVQKKYEESALHSINNCYRLFLNLYENK